MEFPISSHYKLNFKLSLLSREYCTFSGLVLNPSRIVKPPTSRSILTPEPNMCIFVLGVARSNMYGVHLSLSMNVYPKNNNNNQSQ